MTLTMSRINKPKEESKKLDNLKRLDEISKLEENWNDNGAKPFSNRLITKARYIIDDLLIQPEVFPTARNSIQLEYEKKTGEYMEFEIYESSIKVYIVDQNENEDEYEIEYSEKKINDAVGAFYG
jgi:hypothetical protein